MIQRKLWRRLEAGRVPYMAFEWWVMRLGLAWLTLAATPPGVRATGQPDPVGIAKFFDLTWLGAEGTPYWMMPVLSGLTALLVLGVAPLLSAGGLLVLHTAVGTFTNSQGGGGGSHHTTNLVGLMLLGMVLGCLYRDAAALRRGGWRGLVAVRLEDWAWWQHLLRHPGAAFRRASTGVEFAAQGFRSQQIYTTLQMMAMSYVVSGVSKVWRSGGEWLSEVRHLPLQFEKNRLNEFHDTLREIPATAAESMASWVGTNPMLASMLFGGGLALELGAWLGLWNRRITALFGVALIGMHETISELMTLGFALNKVALLVFWVNVPYWLWAGRERWLGRRVR